MAGYGTENILNQRPLSRRLTASNENTPESFNIFKQFSLIKNDGPGDLIIGIDEDTLTGVNLIYLKPTEYLVNVDSICSTLHHRCENEGQQTIFRVVGW